MRAGPFRVLYVTAAGERGGAESVLLTILRHLDRSRFDPEVACLRDGPLADEIRRTARTPVTIVPARRFSDLRAAGAAIGRLRDLIRATGARIVHDNGTGAHLYGGPAARLAGLPSVYHAHDLPGRFWSRQGLLDRLALRVPTATVIAVSEFVARALARHRPRGELRVLHNAVERGASPDPARAGEDARLVRVERGWDPDCPLVVWCGRLQRWKGAHVFVEAAARIRRDVPACRFLVVGGSLFGLEPGYERELRALAPAADRNGWLQFAGQQPEARRFMAAADVVVHSSIRPDPFGLVVVEAMLAGAAVVAAAEGGPREIVEDGASGLLVPPGDAAALAGAVARLLADPAMRRAMAAAGRARAAGTFGVDRLMSGLTGVYEQLLAPRPGAVSRS